MRRSGRPGVGPDVSTDGTAGGDAGVTLVELTVGMAVSAVLLAVLGTFVSQSLSSSRAVTARATAVADARTGLAYLQHDLRVATSPGPGRSPFVLADGNAMTFYTSVGASTATAGPALTEVWYEVRTPPGAPSPCLWRAAVTATATGGVADAMAKPTTGSCAAVGTVNASGGRLFTYYPVATTTTPSPAKLPLGTGGLSPGDALTAAAVRIDLEVTPVLDPSAHPTVLSSRVSLVNVVNSTWNGSASS